MNTKNLKIISKDYLAEQFYNYHKNYVLTMQKSLSEGKQDALIVEGSELYFDGARLSFYVNGNKENGYYLKYEDGKLATQNPIKDLKEDPESNLTVLVSKKAILNFEGTENINTVGNILKGTWEVGRIKINNDSIKIGDTNISINNNDIATIDNADITTANITTATIDNANITTANITNITISNNLKTNKALLKEIEYNGSHENINNEEISVKSNLRITENNNFIFNGKDFKINNLLTTETITEGNEDKKIISFSDYFFKPNKDIYIKILFPNYTNIFDEEFVNDLDN